MLSVMHTGALDVKSFLIVESIIATTEQGSRCNVTLSILVVKSACKICYQCNGMNSFKSNTKRDIVRPNKTEKCMCTNAWVHKNKLMTTHYKMIKMQTFPELPSQRENKKLCNTIIILECMVNATTASSLYY